MAVALDKTRLYLGTDCRGIETFQIAGGSVCVYTHRAPGKDTDNEDSLGLVPRGACSAVLVVADGLGGLPAGDRASSTAVRQISRKVAPADGEPPPVREAILDAIDQANRLVMTQGLGAGTTLAAIEIDQGAIRPYHIGDSEIMLMGQRGRIKYQSISHSPVGYALEAGLLEADDAIYHAERHLVSNVIGSTDMRVEIGPRLELAPRDTLLLGSDGLFDNIPIDEIINLVRIGPILNAAQHLLDICQSRMLQSSEVRPHKPDDLSFILFRPGPGGKRCAPPAV